MFDFTREVQLEPKDRKVYRILQTFLYLGAVLAAIILAILIIFPNRNFSYSFEQPNSSKNNISNVRFTDGDDPDEGRLPADRALFFSTDITNDYHTADVTVTLSNDSPEPVDPQISVRRAYQAFMYPLGDPVGFKDGSLLTSEGNYYIVSGGLLKEISKSDLSRLGYSLDSFRPVSTEELQDNPKGEILDSQDYPDGTVFKVEDDFYLLSGKKLKQFAGEIPFLTRYDSDQAIQKNQDFLSSYDIAEEQIGFEDGTLVSYADSVYVISGQEYLPIDSVQTFEIKGYHWDDVVPAGADEVALYEKGRLFNVRGVHPDGTVYQTEENRFYLVKNGKKHPLKSEKVARSWSKMTPIAVSEKALKTESECVIRKTVFDADEFSCDIPLEEFAGLPGYTYEFNFRSENDIRLESLAVQFEKNISKNNLKAFLVGIYNSILVNYGIPKS